MPPVPNLLLELLAFVLLGLCARDAWRQDRRLLLLLGAALAFGLTLEVVMVAFRPGTACGYTYGPFLARLPAGDETVPVGVGAGWAVLIYGAMRVSNLSGLSPKVQPLWDALLALNIDFVLDPLAHAMGWWTWRGAPGFEGGADLPLACQARVLPDEYLFFGVPYDNFLGWFVIVAAFSFFQRQLWRLLRVGPAGWGRPVLATVLGLALAMGTLMLAGRFTHALVPEPGGHYPQLALWALVFIVSCLLALGWLVHFRTRAPVVWTLALIPLAFHGLLLLLLLAAPTPGPEGSRLLYDRDEFVILAPLIAFAGLVAWWWPFAAELRRLLRRVGERVPDAGPPQALPLVPSERAARLE